ncbi:hypothetical protein BELL_0531g00090 [Botrytis elliptica]|uniref:Uncharacterized protein n=1 Tax=Botrytis elliptica TaxID=278938 RepID=A0A4Z1JKK7_9HELO|nr:hypothetical protein BELL_0531g00090 [Botrytis elliptica]
MLSIRTTYLAASQRHGTVASHWREVLPKGRVKWLSSSQTAAQGRRRSDGDAVAHHGSAPLAWGPDVNDGAARDGDG